MRQMKVFRFLLFSAVAGSILSSTLSSQPALTIQSLKLNWPEVAVALKVTCGSDARTDLTEANFVVQENGTVMTPFTLTCPPANEACCISAALVADRSGSMGWGSPSGLEGLKTGFKAFIDAMDPNGTTCDEATLISFDTKATLDVFMTTDKVLLKMGVDGLVANGGTAVWDAGVMAVQELVANGTEPCKSVVLLTDGEDNASSNTPDDIIAAARANSIRVYTIGLGTGINSADLQRIATATDGTYTLISNPSQISPAMLAIAQAIHNTPKVCTLRYNANCPDGTQRTLRLTLRDVLNCSGTDTRSVMYTAPRDTKQFETADLRIGEMDAGGDETILLPVTLENMVSMLFNSFDLQLKIDSRYLALLGLSTDGCLLAGVPLDITSTGVSNLYKVRLGAAVQLSSPGILFYIRLRTVNPPRSLTSPIQMDSWNFDTGCLKPQLSNGEVRIHVDQPAIIRNPDSLTLCAGQQASFSVGITGDQPLILQWQRSPDSGAHWIDEPGANQPDLTLSWSNALLYDGFLWRLFVARAGGDSLWSAPARLTVAPVVTVASQPVDQSACLGGTAVFTARPSFTAGVNRLWQTSPDSGRSWIDLPAATADTLRLQPVVPIMNGARYRILFTDSCRGYAFSASAGLSLALPPQFLASPANDSACENGAARFIASSLVAGGRRIWQKSTDGGNTFIDIAGETRDTLDLPAVRLFQNGESYRLKAMNPCDTVATPRAYLFVDPAAPAILSQPVSASLCAGDSVRFSVNGSGATRYQWRKNGVDIPGATSASHFIRQVAAADSGVYTLLLVSRCGQTLSNSAQLSVGAPVSILVQPQSQTVKEKDTVRFSVAATGPGLTYQWLKNGGAISGATGPMLVIPSATKGDEGTYSVLVSSSCGQPVVSASAQLSVTIVAVKGEPPVPARPELYPNYPNPFASATTINFGLPRRLNLEISIHDLYGRRIETLTAGEFDAGRHALVFIASSYPPGTYTLMLTTEKGVCVRTVTVVK